jgi:hypothetical protein
VPEDRQTQVHILVVMVVMACYKRAAQATRTRPRPSSLSGILVYEALQTRP